MQQQPVGVDLLFRFSYRGRSYLALAIAFCILVLSSAAGYAQAENSSDYIEMPREVPLLAEGSGYLARIQTNSPIEVLQTLKRAEQLFLAGAVPPNLEPIAFVLHGPEVAIFFKENYPEYREIVDLAAKLTAFNVIDVKVCEARMGMLREVQSSLPPFVDTVPFGPAEMDRLVREQNYLNF